MLPVIRKETQPDVPDIGECASSDADFAGKAAANIVELLRAISLRLPRPES
jgi:hypothetical protein